MPQQIEDLRTHLFETLAALKDKNAPMDLDRARAVADVAKVIVASAKVEVDFLKVTGAARSTNFLPNGDEPPTRSLKAAEPRPGQIATETPPAETRTVAGKTFEVAFNGARGQSLIGERTAARRG